MTRLFKEVHTPYMTKITLITLLVILMNVCKKIKHFYRVH